VPEGKINSHMIFLKTLKVIHWIVIQTIFNHGAVITCPVCRRSDRLQYGIEQLPTNQAVLYIIKLNEKLKCQKLTCLSERFSLNFFFKW
jgi:hypothetical protein